MEIYIEYVIIDNLVINSLILILVKNTLKLKSSWWRIALGAVLGTVVACVLPLLNISQLLQFPIKIALGLVMVLCLAKYVRFKTYIFSFLLFIAYTIIMAGGVLAILMLFGTDIDMLASGGYDIALPYGIILLIVSLYAYIITLIARFLSRKRDINPFIKKIKLYIGKKEIDFTAFIDSGNSLKDKKTGLPVIVVSLSSLEKFFSKEELEELILQREKSKGVFKGVRSISFGTVAGECKKMIIFEADKLVIFNESGEYITNSFMVGVAFKKFKDAIHYDMLLNPAIL